MCYIKLEFIYIKTVFHATLRKYVAYFMYFTINTALNSHRLYIRLSESLLGTVCTDKDNTVASIFTKSLFTLRPVLKHNAEGQVRVKGSKYTSNEDNYQ